MCYAGRLRIASAGIGIDTSLIASKTIAHPQLQVVEPRRVVHELLIADGPGGRG